MKKLFEDPSMIVVPFLANEPAVSGGPELGPDELPIIPIG